MKKISKILLLGVVLLASAGAFSIANVYANEEGNTSDVTETSGTSISLTPVSKILQISSNTVYDSSFVVKNNGESSINVEVYAAPYSYVYSEEDDTYKLGFNNENSYTQISRWITFLDTSGKYVEKTTFAVEPHNSLEVNYRIATPNNIPNGGQYAVIFAHALSNATPTNGIRTEASPGMVVYGRSTDGESIISAQISDLEIGQGTLNEGQQSETSKAAKNNFYALAKIKNTGNIDFNAKATLKVEPIIGGSSYETPSNMGRLSVIPETELTVSDEWTETPDFGIYKITWTVTVGDTTEEIEKIIFLFPPVAIIITIILLTIVIIWTIMRVRKRKERRSRLAV